MNELGGNMHIQGRGEDEEEERGNTHTRGGTSSQMPQIKRFFSAPQSENAPQQMVAALQDNTRLAQQNVIL